MTQRKISYWPIPPNENGEFTAHMENVLETYAQTYDERLPVLCMDEQPVQLLEDINIPIAFMCGSSLPSKNSRGNKGLGEFHQYSATRCRMAVQGRRCEDKTALPLS